MFLFDPKIPSEILSIQRWFASIIARPIDDESQMAPTSPSGRLMSDEAKEFIAPNSKLSSAQRIQIYNQQYWWRMLSILHHNFPTLVRLFGYEDFNRTIGMPFLTKYPSTDWSIAKLGDKLSLWIEEEYGAQDKSLVLFSAKVDWAYQELFLAPNPKSQEATLDLLSKKTSLQNHLKLFALPFDLLSFRTELLKQPVEFWAESEFPKLPKDRKYFFILYRNRKNWISYKQVKEGEWTLLHLIEEGHTIEEGCEYLEKIGGSIYEEALSSLQEWIQQWVSEKWLCLQGE